jgi:hypothetical protein
MLFVALKQVQGLRRGLSEGDGEGVGEGVSEEDVERIDEAIKELCGATQQLHAIQTGGLSEHRQSWDATLTARQQQIHGQSTGQTLGASFMSQATSDVDVSATSKGAWDDGRLYKSVLVTLTKADNNGAIAKTGVTRNDLNTNSAKKTVDRKASKGRKIRYKVHDKLVNFAVPSERGGEQRVNEDVWFKSMFR